MTDTAPLTRKFQATIPATSGGSDYDQSVCEPRFAGTVSAASYVPEAAMSGDNTNGRTLTLVNKGQAGAGTTVVGTLAFTTGVNGVAFDEKAFTLSAVAGATTVADGDVLAFVSTHTGTGIADPGGLAQVEITRS